MKPGVLILTKNEAHNISEAIESCSLFASEVVVLDSISTDGTQDIARNCGARVIEHLFVDFSDQANYGISQLQSEWVFLLDADERVSAELGQFILSLDGRTEVHAYSIRRRNYFAGRWVRHSGWYPDHTPRLFKRELCRFERAVHQELVFPGRMKRTNAHVDHYSYTSVSQYVEKMQLYTTLEALDARNVKFENPSNHTLRSILKRLFRALPFRPMVRFVWMYVIRMGFLDGRVGFEIACLSAFYELIAAMKKRELSRCEPGL